MRSIPIPAQHRVTIDRLPSEALVNNDDVDTSYQRFREQSFFAEECLDLLASIREDPDRNEIFRARGSKRAWLEDISHQRELLDAMSDVLLSWETIASRQPTADRLQRP